MDNKTCTDCKKRKTIGNFSHDYNSSICNGCQRINETSLLTDEQMKEKKRCNTSGNHWAARKDFIRPSGKRKDKKLRENKSCNSCYQKDQARINKRKSNAKADTHVSLYAHPFDKSDLMATTPLGFAWLSKPLINNSQVNIL